MTAYVEKTPASTRLGKQPKQRTIAGIVATAALALLTTACGGSPAGHVAELGSSTTQRSSSSSARATSAQGSGLLAFAQCMRRHGVANFPDPNSSGNFPASAKRVALSAGQQYQEARTACSNLLPNGGNGPTPAQWQQIMVTLVEFAHCMRHHGMPNWPDPTYDSHGRPVFNIDIDPNSPQFSAEIHACQHLLHNYGARPGWPDLSNYFQYTH